MRLAYVDEAGLSNPKHEPYVVVAAAIIDPDRQLDVLRCHLDALVEKHIPPEHRKTFVFHAKEIFLGGRIIKRDDPAWSDERRFAIARDLAAIPANFGIPLAFGWIERASAPENFGLPKEASVAEQTVAAHAAAFLTCSLRVDLWMRQHASAEVCLEIVEDNNQARKTLRDSLRLYQDRRIETMLSPKERSYFPFQRIREDPLFQEKRKLSVLQIADFVAYIFKRYLVSDSHYDEYIDAIRSQIVNPT